MQFQRLTMKAATFAIFGPHVSAIISSVRAFVAISIPLLTKINSGRFLSSNSGLRAVSVSLCVQVNIYTKEEVLISTLPPR